MGATIAWGTSSLRELTSSLLRCAAAPALLALATTANAQGTNGPFPSATLEAMRAARLTGTTFTPLEDYAPESSGPERWSGFDALPARVKRNLADPASTHQLPAFGTNVRANDPTGDLTSDAQHYTVVSAWGRFVVVAWLDTKGRDTPTTAPPNTYGGYAYSCDWGQTFTDAGNLPHPKTNEQLYLPSLANDGRGRFYMVATCDTLLDASGVSQVTALAFWQGTFDTTACTFAWGPRQMLVPGASQSGFYPSFARVVADPYDDYVYVVYSQFAPARQDVGFVASPDGGQNWSSPATLSNTSTTWSLFPDLAVGPDHELYVCWGEYSWYYWCDFSTPFAPPGPYQWAKSTDRGATWTAPATLAQRFSNYTSNGPMDRFGWTKDFPRIAVDRSSGPGRGNVYAVFGGSAVRSSAVGTGTTVAEVEPNELPSGAVTVAVGDDGTGGSPTTTDRDLWRVFLTAGQVLTARVEPQGYVCGSTETPYGYSLRLYPEFANPATFNTDSLLQAHYHTSSIASITFSCRVSGWYYLAVLPQNIVAGTTYVLRTRLVSFTQIAGSGRDEGDILLTRTTNGGASWSTPSVVNHDVPEGYQETGWNVNVDASGRVRVVWHDHRETESDPPLALRGQLTDLYLAESSDQGATFGPGLRVSDETSLFGPGMRVTFVQVGHHGDLQADGDHLFFGWDDQRLSTRTTQNVDAMTLFVDKEAPRTAWVAAPADASFLTSAAADFAWSVDDRRNRHTGNESSWELRDPVNNALVASGPWSADSTSTLGADEFDAHGDGPFRFDVYARDAGQNPAPVMSRSFLLDRTVPSVSITSGPAPGSWITSASADFAWTASDPTPGWNGVPGSAGVETSYRLDGGAWSAWGTTTAANYTGLAPGAHQFDLRARDAAGNETAQSCSFNTTGLVGWWAGEGSAADSWGTNAGTLMNGAGFAAGQRGQAFSFDGVDDYVTVPDHTSLDPRTGSFSVELWVKTTQTVPLAMLLAKYEGGGSPSPPPALSVYQLYLVNGAPLFYLRDSDGGGAGPGGGEQILAASIADGNWHHLVANRDVTAGTFNLYVDGVLAATSPLGPGSSGSLGDDDGAPDDLFLGASFDGGTNVPNYFLHGAIDEPAYWSRALSAAEIAANYAAGGRAPCSGTATREFAIDTQSPETAFLTGPAEGSTANSSSADFTWQGTDDQTAAGQLEFRSRLDGGAWSAWGAATAASLTSLSEGPHVFEVASRDLAGNEDATPATRAWTVRAVAPVVTILSGPDEGAYTNTAPTFAWTSVLSPVANRAATAYEYDLDGFGFTPVGSDTSLTLELLLFDGAHTLTLRATDDAGLQGTATRSWFHDTNAPGVSFTRGPDEGGTSPLDGVVFGWFGNDAMAPAAQLTYSWSLDGAAFGAPAPDTTITLNGLAAGPHTFAVRGHDLAGNVSVAITRSWTAVPPQLAGTYTIGVGGDYATFAAAMADLGAAGVSGPVTFDVLSGIYAERLVVPPFAGASSTNRVTIRSQTGNASDVAIIVWPSPIELQGASHVTLSSLTVQLAPLAGEAAVQFSGPGTGNRLLGCTITVEPTTGPGIGIFGGQDDLEVSGNTVVAGIDLVLSGGDFSDVRILANRLLGQGVWMGGWTGPATGCVLLANNFVAGGGLAFYPGANSGGVEISHNSIRSDYRALEIVSAEPGYTPASFRIHNNVLHAEPGAVSAMIVADADIVAASDHNDIHSLGANFAAWNGISVTSLGELRATSGMDLASVSGDPGFVSTTDLHATAALLNGAGTPLANVTTDIDGEPRNATSPDIGADEFTPVIPPLAGTYTIGAGGSYPTFAAAMADLQALGISAPVTFDVLPGTYAEQVVVPQYGGGSATNRVTIRSQSGNPADATVSFATSAVTQGVVEIADADYVTLSALTIQVTQGTGLGSGVLLSGTANGARIENCDFTGLQSSGNGVRFSGAVCESLVVHGNRIHQSLAGVLGSAALLTGARITGNSILNAVYSIYLDAWIGPTTGAFLLANNMLGATVYLRAGVSSNGAEVQSNTVVVPGAADALNLVGGAFGSAADAFRVRNNILACTGGGIALTLAGGASLAVSDHNLLYTTGSYLTSFAGLSSTLAEHQASNNHDLNSVSFHPGIVSATDFHTTLAGLDARGTLLPEVTTDFDGEPRDPGTPDIGADEFAPGVPLAGTYTVGAGGDFTTLSDASAALLARGVSAAVSFAVLPGTYFEKLVLQTAAGVSPANRVLFHSQSGSAVDASIRYATASTAEGVIELRGADWTEVRDLGPGVTNVSGLGSGVYVTGHTVGSRVTRCTVEGLQVNGYGVRVAAAAESLEISDNFVSTGTRGISIENARLAGVRVLNNRVASAVLVSFNLTGWIGTASGAVLVANNAFAAPVNIGTTNASAVGVDVFHNSVAVPTGGGHAITIAVNTGSVPTGAVRLRNNVFAALTGGRAISLSHAGLLAESDHNDLFAVGSTLASVGAVLHPDLASWQATGRDANSLSTYPGFFSETDDLHTNLSFLDGLGAPLAEVTTDMDGEPRDLATPDIGCDEFAPNTPLAGTFTVGSGGDYGLASVAVNELLQRGVSGPVTFDVLTGWHVGRWRLYTPAGASPANRVTIRSQTGTAADATLRFSPAGTSEGVVELRGADHVTFSDLTLEVTSVGVGGSAVLLLGRSTGARIERCAFTGLGNAGYGVNLVTAAIVESLEVTRCTMSGGIGISGADGVGMTGVRITRNAFETSGSSGAPLNIQRWNGPATGALFVANNFFTGSGRVILAQGTGSSGLEFHYNSVNLASTLDVLYLQDATGTTPAATVRMLNNIFVNRGGGRAINVQDVASIVEFDHNDLYKPTAGTLALWGGVGYADLAALQAGTGFHANSVSGDPQFASLTDLHTTAPLLDQAGAPITAVTDDFDGEVRGPAPDIGADEYLGITDTTPPSLAYTAGPADGATLLGDTTSYAWSATDDVSAPGAITYRSALDAAFSGAYDAATSRALAGLGDGVHTFRVEARDEAGNVSAPAERTLRVHTTAPDLTFDSPPNGAFTGADVTVAWHGTQLSAVANPESTFYEHRLDGGAFSAPSRDSSVALAGLPEGAHTVEVRVTDNMGLTATRPVSFTVDATPPVASIASGPAEGGYSSPSASFTFSATDNLTPANQLRFSRSLDGGPFTAPSTTASASFGDLGPGPHTLAVRALDAADNASADVTRQWTVDASPPETQLTGGPADGSVVTSNAVTFDFTGSDDLTPLASLRFQARLDGGSYDGLATETSRSYTGLSDGAHSFEVRAADLAGLVDATPEVRAFTVDAQGPAITIASGPANNACVAGPDVAFAWSATDAVTPQPQIEFSYQLDAAPFTPYGPATDASFTSLDEGLHTFTLQARDGSGHVTSVARTFRVDVSAPLASAPTTHVLDAAKIRIQCTATDNSGVTGFRVQVSTDPAFGTVVADVQIGSGGTHDYIGVPGNSYYARAQASDCAGNLSAFTAPSNVAVLASLPNLLVTGVTAPPAAVSGQAIVVDYTVANQGAGPTSTPSWVERAYLSPAAVFDAGAAVLLGQRQNVTYLGVGETYTGSITGTVPLGTSGARWVHVVADAGNVVPESDGADNTTASDPVAVSLGAVADLVVTQVVAPPTALSSETIAVSWTVLNDGGGRTDATQWWDTVFLSDDAVFDFTVLGGGNIRVLDQPLARFLRTGALEADSSYSRTEQVTLPAYFGGTHYLFVASDLSATQVDQAVSERGAVFEDQHELNATAAEATEVTQQLPPDLTVDGLTSSGAAFSGGGLQVTYTVGNHGFNATGAGAWTDQLYLSADAVLDGSDVLLASFPHSGNVDLDATYAQVVNVTLPKGISGPRWLILKVDAYAQLVEYLENNNVAPAAQALDVTLSPWANLVPVGVSVSDTVLAGGSGVAHWQVSNAGTAAVTATFTDNVELGTGPVWTSNARVSGSKRATRNLPPGESYEASATFDVPSSYAGVYHVFARTDVRSEVFEHTDEGDNVALVGTVYVKPYPAIDLAVSNVTIPADGVGGSPLAVGYTVTNEGGGTTLSGWWAEDVWLSADATFSASQDLQVANPGHAGALAAGAGYTRNVNANVPQGLNGTFHVLVRSDPGGGSGDGSLANNTVASAGTVTITSPPPPQLTVSGVTVAPNLDAGQPALVSWQLNNTGPGEVPNAEWFVGLYLSQDPWLDASDVSLGSIAGPAGLAGGASAPQQYVPTMPVWASGAYYVIVRADNRNEVWEATGENDNSANAPTLLTLPPPSDLVVTDVVVPPAAVPGEPILLSWTLTNQGANPAVGQLQNAAYMSTDAVFVSDDDPLVGVEVVNINLPPGGSQRFAQKLSARPLQVDLDGNVTALLPALSPGAYHAIVKANIRDNIRESNGANNETVSAAQVQTDLPSLALGVPMPFDLANGQARFWKVAVPADFDLRLTLASDVADATNEMFVAFGRTPDANEYDFSGPAEFTANPVVLVPQTQAGTYYVMVVARGLGQVASLENVTLLAETLPFSIASHTPGAGGAGGRVTVRVRGAGLRDTTEFRLEQAGIVRARATLAKFTNSTDVLARFDLAGVSEGLYDLVAANGLTTVVVPGGFSVEPPRPIEVVIETDNADVLRRSAVAPFTVRLRNPSNQDAPVVRARVLFPATSQLRTLETAPGLFRASQLVPALAPVVDDAVVLRRAGGGDSLLAGDVMGSNLAPGEVRSLTLGISGFESSPYSVRVLADAMTLREFLDRQQAGHEAARRALLADPAGVPPDHAATMGDAFTFRDEALLRTYVDTGALPASDVEDYLVALARLVPPSPDYAALPAGPQSLLDELAAGGPCADAGEVPECAPEVAVPGTALPACASVYETSDLPVPVATSGGRLVRTQGSTTAGYTSTASANTRIVVPCDPNLMTGPAGFGTEKWVRGAAAMPYRVDFENLPGVASAPAQVVRITVPIDPNLDLTTFRVGSMGFGGTKQINVPAGRTSYSSQTYYSDLNLSVRITAGINLTTREATWVFTTIDPATGQQPTNPYVGFLPVNDDIGSGTGFVTYSIQPYASAASGSTVQAQASIQFDVNTPVPTNTAMNRVDTRLPASAALTGIEVLDPTRVRVHWTGSDDSTGAGLANVTLYVRQDAGAFSPVAPPTAGSFLEVPVTDGHTFAFHTLAADNVGNTEAAKSGADPGASITVGSPQLGADGSLPRVTALHQNYPNPFRGGTKVRFDLARAEKVTLDIYDVQGRLVGRPLDAKALQAGSHVVDVSRLPRGASVYFYRLRAGAYEKTRRMVLVP